jgi:histidyl-tRNA synthetase
VLSELQKPEEAGGAGLDASSAGRVLEFVETGRGGPEVLDQAMATLGANPSAAAGIKNLQEVASLLAAGGVPAECIAYDLGLARGLDYYTGIVYETTINGWERFGSVASGGRYDNLASLFTSRRLPGVGASIGLDRLLALLDEAGQLSREATMAPVLVALFTGIDPLIPFTIAARLRAFGIGAEVFPDCLAIGKQMGYGSSRGHRVAVIVGPDEQARGVFTLRNLQNRHETRDIALDDLVDVVAHAVDAASSVSPTAEA